MIGGQTYLERPPHPALAERISSVWTQQVAHDAAPYAHRTIPNGAVEISVRLGSALRVIGPQTAPTEDVLAPGAAVVGVRLRHGAAPSLLGVPASELVDLTVDASELWGDDAARLEEALSSATAARGAAVLERAVLARMPEAAPLDPIVAETVRGLLPGGADEEIASLSSRLFISERQLRRRCLAAVGLAPKPLQRTLRFQGFLALAHARGLTGADLGALAAEAGYADQPHLNRESVRLAGSSPLTVLRGAEEHCRGVHDHAASYAPLVRSFARAA